MGMGTRDWGKREEEFTTEGNSEVHGGHGGKKEEEEGQKVTVTSCGWHLLCGFAAIFLIHCDSRIRFRLYSLRL